MKIISYDYLQKQIKETIWTFAVDSKHDFMLIIGEQFKDGS